MKGIVTKRFRAVREGSIHPVWIEPGTELDGELADIARSIGALDETGVATMPPAAAPATAASLSAIDAELGKVTVPVLPHAKPSRRARLLKRWVDEADADKPAYAKGTFVDGETAERAVAANAAVFVATAAGPETK